MDFSDLIVQAQPWQWLALAGTALGLTALLYAWGEDRPRPVWLLAILRAAVLGILGFLLLNPMLRTTTETREAPVLPVLVDATSSQWLGEDSMARKEAMAKFIVDVATWGDVANWDVDLFSFDRDVTELQAANWNPHGKRTDLGSALETIRDRYVHRNVPAVVVVTDGRANRGPDPEFTASRLDAPHLFIGTGDTALVTDFEVTKFRINEVAYLGNTFPVEVTFQARGAENVPMTLRLSSGKTTLDTRTWTPNHNFSSTRWTVQVNAEVPGPMTLKASITPDPSWVGKEVTTINNRKQATIDILESQRQILIVAAAPHPDIAAVRNAAETNVHQETNVIWVSELDGGATLPDHDVLVMHHLTPSLIPSVVTDAIQRARAVWILGGATTAWNDWDLNLVGFQNDFQPLVTESKGHTASDFESFPLPTDLDRMLALWPPLACPTGEYTTTPALVSALHQQVGPVNTDWPLWAVREGDSRRVAVTLGEGLWRWRMQDLVIHDGESAAFDELVNRTLQYLSSRDDVKRLRIRAPERMDEDLRCQLTAEVYDASLSPTINVEVSLELMRNDAEPTVHRFIENSSGTDFSLDLGMLLPGVYNWVATCTQNGEQLSERGRLVVNAVQAEASLVPADHGLLRRLALRTEGAYLGTLNDSNDMEEIGQAWAAFADGTESQDVVHTSSERMPLHAQLWLLLTLLIMLTAEWAIRRASGSR